ncbi:acyl-CoA N-acyltransferase [Stipitochalara longipes BDJ]|nr:acyl-CoA N-acyltransferase [Stipitochalara longipes BDJ]
MAATQIPQHSSYFISPAQSPKDVDAVRSLISTYSKTQVPKQVLVLTSEAASLPGRYSLPHGEMLLARATTPDQAPIGWVGLRPFPELSNPQVPERDTDICQFKRLFVLEEYRRKGIGKALVEEVIKTAREKGYKEIRISAEVHLEKEIEMYKRRGFVVREKYFEGAEPELVFLALQL